MRRLICFDMDSTLIQTECIDELAEKAGVGEQVRAITESAMRGEIDFKESFTQRVALLKGLDEGVMKDIAENLPITEGVERLMFVLKRYGYKIAILSGGFTYFGEYLQKKFGIDYVYANELEIIDGKLTGRYLGDVVDGKRKAELLRLIAQVEKVDIAQTIAVGDGANDLPMLSLAGLGFPISKYPYYRHVLTYYATLKDEKSLNRVVSFENKLEFPTKMFRGKSKKETKDQFVETLEAINNFAREYNCLKRVLTEDGYISVIDNILRGNTAYVKHVYEALDNYIASRDINKLLGSLDENKLSVLNFAYTSCKNYANYLDIINKLLEIRIYHEVIRYEEECKDDLAMLVDYHNITAKIYKLKEQQLSVAYELCAGKNSRVYDELYESSKDNKDYLYQISKKSKYWPIRKTMEVYSKFILTLFPCWLLSPENVSNLLPLTKNLFDVVIFDEASQVFIESTIPTIYRGKSIVVAGDDKQLRPSATFMKRYLGADPDTIDDYSVQAALEVDSLLDLAVSRYDSSNLTYHYRSKHQELIDFSNYAFYNGNLQVSPNISKNRDSRPIERYKVRGRWIDRKNTLVSRFRGRSQARKTGTELTALQAGFGLAAVL